MKFCFLDPVLGNNYGVLTYYQTSLMAALEKRGIASSLISPKAETFTRDLLRHLLDDETVFYAGNLLYDLRFSAQNHFVDQNLFEACGARVMARMGDHAFTNFMVERVRNTALSTLMWVDSPSMMDEVRYFYDRPLDMQPIQEYSFLPPEMIGGNKPHRDRGIDVLVPMSVAQVPLEPFLDRIKAASPNTGLPAFCLTLYQIIKDTYGRQPLFQCFVQAVEHHGLTDWRSFDPAVRDVFRSCLSELDHIVRNTMRIEALASLADMAPHLTVAVTGTAEHFARAMPPNVRFLGPTSFQDTIALQADSRIIINAPASFPEIVHERVLNASAQGCATVSLYADGLAKWFAEGRDISFISPERSAADLCAALDAGASQDMGDRAREIVETRFTPDLHVDQFLARLSP